MFQASMRSGRTSATAQATARSWIFSESRRRRAAVSFLESSRPGMRRAGSRMTAAATTGPKSAPRPTSSTPAMRAKPSRPAWRSCGVYSVPPRRAVYHKSCAATPLLLVEGNEQPAVTVAIIERDDSVVRLLQWSVLRRPSFWPRFSCVDVIKLGKGQAFGVSETRAFGVVPPDDVLDVEERQTSRVITPGQSGRDAAFLPRAETFHKDQEIGLVFVVAMAPERCCFLFVPRQPPV